MNAINKYFLWNCVELKTELRKRGLRLSGKKKDLQERLLFYDKNKDFLAQGHQVGPDNVFWTPEASEYRDVNGKTNIPLISESQVELFLSRYNVKTTLGKQMYENYYLLYVRIAEVNDSFFLRGHCLAQMKKSVQYKTDVKINKDDGFIEGSHCECAVGSGDTAHCKHVAVLLWAMVQMGREKKMNLRTVCTQQLQTFHRPSRIYLGSPIKAAELPKDSQKITQEPMVLDPNILDMESYREKVRNKCINFAATHETTMPYLQLLKPADTYAAIWDHAYTGVDPEKIILNDFKLLQISIEEITRIEIETRGQSSNKTWFEYRENRITASNFYTCCIIREEENQMKVARQLINRVPFKSKATDWGLQNETKAINIFETTGVNVDTCGFFISQSHPFLGASPDGLIGTDTVVEVKCPFSRKSSQISEITLPFLCLDDNSNLALKKNHPYFYQIQGQLLVTGRSEAKLVIYTTVETVILTIALLVMRR